MAGGMEATIQAPTRTTAFAVIREIAGIGRCSSSFAAPLWRSPVTNRIATNGSRKAAASSMALNVGAQMPMRGENASPTPADVPSRPLSSAYVRIALMNATPTSGPISRSITHHALEASSSRHSLRSSHRKGPLRKGKHDLLEVSGRRTPVCRDAGKLLERPLPADTPAAQEHEAVAHSQRVLDLVDGKQERASHRRMLAKRRRHLACLTKIQPVERLIAKQKRLGCE